MLSGHVDVLRDGATAIGAVVRGITDPDHLPAVLHCHDANDPAAIVALVLLLALGVERDTVAPHASVGRWSPNVHRPDIGRLAGGHGLANLPLYRAEVAFDHVGRPP